MVPEGRRHGTSDVWTIGEAALRAILVAGGAGGACDPASAGRGHTGDRPAGGAVGVDDLAGLDALRPTGATRPRAAAAWSIGQLSRNGMPNGPPGVRSLRSLQPTWCCGRMCRIGCLAWLLPRAGPRCPGRRCGGRAGGTDLGRTGAGPRRGARSRSPTACGSTFPGTRRCASATRPSTSRFTCRAGARCGAS